MEAGTFLHASSSLDNTFFENAVIYMTKGREIGFVVNKLFDRKLNELVEFSDSVPFPLYDGGPVGHDHLYILHRRPDLIPGGISVAKDVYAGGDFKAVVKYLQSGALIHQDVKILVGYCGWDANELESEVKEGSWVVGKEGSVFG